METIQHTDLKALLQLSINKSIDYKGYRTLVKQLVAKESTTGNNITESLVNYTMLNDRRMNRWDKTVKVPPAIQENLPPLKVNQTWLVLTESWCGDAAHVMPVINKIAELNDTIDFRIVLRDENQELMNQFLTNGGQSIPKLIMIDNETLEVLNTYGPRPTKATKLVSEYKAEHGKLTPEFKEELQRWYNKDKGQNIIQDLITLLQ